MAAMMLMDTIILSFQNWDSDFTSFKEMVPIAITPLFLPKIPLPTKLLKLVTFHIVTLYVDKNISQGVKRLGVDVLVQSGSSSKLEEATYCHLGNLSRLFVWAFLIWNWIGAKPNTG